MLNPLFDTSYLELTDRYFINTKNKSYALIDPRPGQTIVEMGCGIGLDAKRISEFGAQVIGLDHDPEFIDYAQQFSVENLKFTQAECDQTGLESDSIDAIRYERVLQHIKDKKSALAEAYRIAKPGGKLCIVDSDFVSCNLFLENIDFEQKLIKHLYTKLAPYSGVLRELPLMMKEAGFEVTKFEVIPNFLKGKEDICSIINFDKAANAAFQAGVLNEEDMTYWNQRSLEELFFSFYSLIYLGIKN